MLNIQNIFYKIYLTFRFLLFYIFFLILIFSPNYANAETTIDDIITTISKLTCETEGVGNLLRSEFSHTCLPASFATIAVGSAFSLGAYTSVMLRLKINDSDLFPNFTGGQCKRVNRANPKNPTISFALCNNVLLAAARVEAIADALIAIAASAFTGEDPWNDIASVWNVNKNKYHTIYEDAKVGDNGVNLDVTPGIPTLFWKVVQIDDRICVSTISLGGWISVGCKYIKEPYPESVYANFMNKDAPKNTDNNVNDNLKLTTCSIMNSPNGDETCYQRAYDNSKSAIVITSPLIECIKEMSARLLFGTSVCTFDDINNVMSSDKMRKSSFFAFQKNMRKFVIGLLTIYVIFFGIRIILSAHEMEQKDIINFILKMIFVIYFSVGINVNNVNEDRLDGMTSFAFPFLLNGISEISSWVMNASPSGLCDFSKDKYDEKIHYMSLWDSLDCRIAHYLGLDMVATLYVENMSRTRNFSSFDVFNFSAPPYVYLLIPAIISGNTTLISLAISYPLLVISVGAFVVNAVVMCFVAISILGILAPLFVPMYLFEYSRGYFDAWAKLMLSFMIQPMVAITFMIFMFGVYDFGFYGTCKYTSKEIGNSITDGGDGKRKVKIFYVDNDWTKYTDEDIKKCKNSLGFMLNNPVSTFVDFTKDKVKDMMPSKERTSAENIASLGLGIVMGPGLFFSSPKLLYEKVRDMSLALIVACFILYLMYHFSAQLDKFMADMTNSVSLGSVTIGAQTIFKGVMKAVGAAGGAAGAAKGGNSAAGGDKMSTRSGAGGDKMSTSSGTGGDKMSTGGSSSKAGDSISSSARNIAKNAMGKVATSVKDNIQSNLENAISEGTNISPSSEKDSSSIAQDNVSSDAPKENGTSSGVTKIASDMISSKDTKINRSTIKDIALDPKDSASDSISGKIPKVDASSIKASDSMNIDSPKSSTATRASDSISEKAPKADDSSTRASDSISEKAPKADDSSTRTSDSISEKAPKVDDSSIKASDSISEKAPKADDSSIKASDSISEKAPNDKLQAEVTSDKQIVKGSSDDKE